MFQRVIGYNNEALCSNRTYLTVVSVESLQLFDIGHVDALRQRLSAQVGRGKRRQGVRRICKQRKKKMWSAVTQKHRLLKKNRCVMKDAEVCDLKFDTSVDKQLLREPTSPLSVPMYCWWCWLWAATDCSGVLLQCWELPHRLSDIPSTFWRGLNLQ